MRTLLLALLVGCTDSSPPPTVDGFEWPVNTQGAVTDYARLADSSYELTLTTAVRLENAIEDFLADASPDEIVDAREAWTAARATYLETEVFRFPGSPAEASEQRLNAWPIDPTQLDRFNMDNVGLVAQEDVDLAPENLSALHQDDGSTDVIVGYHALEFMLFAPDDNGNLRSHEAYQTDAPNSRRDRRRRLLENMAAVLVADLQPLQEPWDAAGSATTSFIATPQESFETILVGMLGLVRDEITQRNVVGPFTSGDPTDVQSRFANQTTNDIEGMLEGLNNVWTGSNGSVNGVGVQAVVQNVDPDLAIAVNLQILETIRLAERLEEPFTDEIRLEDNEEGRARVQALVDGLATLDELLVEVFTAFMLTAP